MLRRIFNGNSPQFIVVQMQVALMSGMAAGFRRQKNGKGLCHARSFRYLCGEMR